MPSATGSYTPRPRPISPHALKRAIPDTHMKNFSLTLLGLLAAPLLLSALPTRDTLSFAPARGASVSMTYEVINEMSMDDMAVLINGEENPMMPSIEMNMVTQAGAQGIGLLRSEFMFMNRDDIPSEDEQVAQLKSVIDVMGKRPVTVRTLDVGAEKPVAALLNGIDPAAVANLGLRGIRLSLARPEALKTQFRAILRAANSGSVRILLPMISAVSEVRKAREILKKSAEKLTRQGIKIQQYSSVFSIVHILQYFQFLHQKNPLASKIH